MFERWTERARKVQALANQESQRFNHQYVGPEHILLGLIKEGSGVGAHVLKNLAPADLQNVRTTVEKLMIAEPDLTTMGRNPLTPQAANVLSYAMDEAKKLNSNNVGTEHILLGLMGVKESIAFTVLESLGLDLPKIRQEVLSVMNGQVDTDAEDSKDNKTLTPKFLDRTTVEAIIREVLNMVMGDTMMRRFLKRPTCHIVVLAPSMTADEETSGGNYPNYPINPAVLASYSYGNKSTWTGKYDEIAKCKALQLWHGRNDGRTDVMPHLLFPGDTIYWGGVKREGIVVACSGVQPYFDRMIAGLIADMIIGVTYHLFVTDENVKSGKIDFLS